MAKRRALTADQPPALGAAPSPAAPGATTSAAVMFGLEHAAAIDLVGRGRYRYWPARDQRPRQTCVAFAVAACVELLRAGTGNDFIPLSEQFLYWHMRRRKWPGKPPPGWAQGATKLGYAKEVLAQEGICSRDLCPYVAELLPGVPLEGAPPSAAAATQAATLRITDSHYVDHPHAPPPPGTARLVYELLSQAGPVALALPEFPLIAGSSLTNWDNPTTFASGEVIDPPAGLHRPADPAQSDAPGHAVCIVGFQPDPGKPTGGWFIFRNSFGRDWAYAIDLSKPEPPHVPARGYGAISASHIEHHAWEVLGLRLS